jgi:methylene-tetrahydromethanopterin dehydrogenase
VRSSRYHAPAHALARFATLAVEHRIIAAHTRGEAMEKPFILHMLTSARHVSPFDVNMGCDAGYDVVVPYTGVSLEDVTTLTQDAIFSRGPKGARRTGIYLGGRDVAVADDMLKAAKKAMVPPFEVSVFVDPSGAFTTAAALIACVERQLTRKQASLDGQHVVILGGTGPVGAVASVLAAQAGARVVVASRQLAHAKRTADELRKRYSVATTPAQGATPAEKAAIVKDAAVILACGAPGVTLLSKADLENCDALLVVADVNAVPPPGVEGVGAMDDGVDVTAASGKAVGVGALAIGNVKYQTQRSMLEAMRTSDKAIYADFRDALMAARKHAS